MADFSFGIGNAQNNQASTYQSSHWDQPNVLAHIRVNDRTDADGAIAKAAQILELRRELLPVSASPEKPLGFSAGIAAHLPACPETVDGLLARGDAAMYDVKRRGKGTYALAPAAQPN